MIRKTDIPIEPVAENRGISYNNHDSRGGCLVPENQIVKRTLDLSMITGRKSGFLFGPRQTGKSTLIRQSIGSDVPYYNLLDHTVFRSLSADPSRMRQELVQRAYSDGLVVVDEIQRLPELLDEVHLLIEERNLRFLLTGSSARKLRSAGVNLLGGRAGSHTLHPLTWAELGPLFDLKKALNFGLLPSIYFSTEPAQDLADYVGLYLDQEIRAESVVRQLSSFSRFLSVAAQCSGEIINYSNVANDAQEKRHTITEYFEILKDTLIAYELPAWRKTKKRKPIETSKFYFFDVGVARAINNLPPLTERSKDFGHAFEHFIGQELRAFANYQQPHQLLHYWRSTSNFEVDFILNEKVAVEVKAKTVVGEKDLKGIRALRETHQFFQFQFVRPLCTCWLPIVNYGVHHQTTPVQSGASENRTEHESIYQGSAKQRCRRAVVSGQPLISFESTISLQASLISVADSVSCYLLATITARPPLLS